MASALDRLITLMIMGTLLAVGTVPLPAAQGAPATLEATPVSGSSATPFDVAALYECEAIPAYMEALEASIDPAFDLTPEEARVVLKWDEGGITYDTARPSEARILSAFFDEYAAGMEQIPDEDVPFAVGDFHAAKIREYGMLSAGYNAVAQGDLFTAMVYTEQEEEVYAEIDRAYAYVVRACGKVWTNAWEGE